MPKLNLLTNLNNNHNRIQHQKAIFPLKVQINSQFTKLPTKNSNTFVKS